MRTERDIELKLKKSLERMGCLVYKFVSPNNAGVPDRIVIYPTGRVDFVELKCNTGVLSPIQKVQIAKLKSHNANVYVVVGDTGVDAYLHEVRDAI